jgi:hypothetical protein
MLMLKNIKYKNNKFNIFSRKKILKKNMCITIQKTHLELILGLN